MAVLPYNQFRSFVRLLLLFFSFLRVKRGKRKEKLNKKEAISQLGKEVEEVRESKIVTNHVNQLGIAAGAPLALVASYIFESGQPFMC